MFSNASSLIRAPPRLAVATMLVTPSCAKMFACIRKSTPNLRHRFRGDLIFARGSCTNFCKSGWCMAFHDGPPRLHKPPPHLHPILPQILQCTLSLVRKIHKPAGRLLPARRGWFVFGPSWMRERNTCYRIKLFSTLICQIQDGGICPFGTATGWKNIDTLSSHQTHVTPELKIRGSMRFWLCPIGFSPLDGDSHSMQLVSFTANLRKLESQNASMLNSQRNIHAIMFATHLPFGFSKN